MTELTLYNAVVTYCMYPPSTFICEVAPLNNSAPHPEGVRWSVRIDPRTLNLRTTSMVTSLSWRRATTLIEGWFVSRSCKNYSKWYRLPLVYLLPYMHNLRIWSPTDGAGNLQAPTPPGKRTKMFLIWGWVWLRAEPKGKISGSSGNRTVNPKSSSTYDGPYND